jgi:hypothetical protein
MFFFSFFILIFGDHVLPFLFLSIIYIYIYLFSIFSSFTFYLYQSILEKDKREREYLFVVSQ